MASLHMGAALRPLPRTTVATRTRTVAPPTVAPIRTVRPHCTRAAARVDVVRRRVGRGRVALAAVGNDGWFESEWEEAEEEGSETPRWQKLLETLLDHGLDGTWPGQWVAAPLCSALLSPRLAGLSLSASSAWVGTAR
jgi:hypothetical protein